MQAGNQINRGLFLIRLSRAAYSDPSRRKIQWRFPIAIRRLELDIGVVARIPEMRLQSSPALWRLLWSCQSGAMNGSLPFPFDRDSLVRHGLHERVFNAVKSSSNAVKNAQDAVALMLWHHDKQSEGRGESHNHSPNKSINAATPLRRGQVDEHDY
jgi:hypothetical protein